MNVLSGAPYGYRYVDKHPGGGQARYEVVPDEARRGTPSVRLGWARAPEHGEVCRRLTQAGEVTRTGKTVWDRSVVWGILHNPAYKGAAASGRRAKALGAPVSAPSAAGLSPATTGGLNRGCAARGAGSPSRFRPSWHRPVRRRPSATPGESTPRPPITPWRAVSAARLVQCHDCGHAFYGKPIEPQGRQGAHADVRPSSLSGHIRLTASGERVSPVRRSHEIASDLAVWQEVCAARSSGAPRR